jgi:hypothetical protein
MRLIFCFLFLMGLFFSAAAQDISGIWTGTLVQEAGGCFTSYHIELQINYIPSANTISGKSYDYQSITQYVKQDFSGRFNPTSQRMVLVENNLLESKIPVTCIACVKTYDLVFSRQGYEEMLTGSCKGREYGTENVPCPAYKVILKRAAESAFRTDIQQTPELLELQKNLKLEQRTKEIVHDIKLESPEIKIDVYDNAEVDNDTVTLLVNNRLLAYRKMLKTTPVSLQFKAFAGTDYELMMYADNLGSIPPNTALLVVTAGAKKYELRLASSNQKTAVVRFRYDKK